MVSRIVLLIVTTFISTFSLAQNTWPKEIALKSGGKVVIYQPQPDDLTGNKLTGRAAVSVNPTAKDEPIFGAIFYEATISTDKDTRMATLETLNITKAKFPGVEDQTKIDKLTNLIETEVPKWKLETTLDELVATIRKENIASGADFNNKPPKILYRDKPSTLVILDGEPKIQKDIELDADRVVNSPYLIFKEGNQWNLYVGGLWYKSTSVKSGWSQNTKLSAKVKSIDAQIKKQEQEELQGAEPEKPVVREIIVSTEPAELLQTTGEPVYKNVLGTNLLYLDNSPNLVFKAIDNQKTYILIAGRWFAASSLQGPWQYVGADKLPADFAKIPEGSERDAVLASVAGTEAAEEAKIDAEIPQTAKVDRKTATTKVEYDGKPKFDDIEGTSLELAENSNITVLKDASGRYFALDNGVWFVASNPTGPWAVATERPKDVENIPASSEAYNTKYVYIYETTPEYVVVGYTPGYVGSYVDGPTVVYGTGYYYPPWYGSVYYPAPVTWGMGYAYNPYAGWYAGSAFVGLTVGLFVGAALHGWFHGGCYPGYGWGHVSHYGDVDVNIDRGDRTVNRGDRNVDRGDRNRVNGGRNNVYKDRPGVATREDIRGRERATTRPSTADRGAVTDRRATDRAAANRPTTTDRRAGADRPTTANRGGLDNRPTARPANTANNVYADRNGDVYRRDNQGNWNQRNNSSRSWQSASNFDRGSMNRESQMRSRSSSRNYNASRSMGSRGGMSRGGGGRRR
ncbi:hypothetical protein H8S95_06215 [Pontibacter sp. KCTC 32443]|uniref:hypothetical protein n=1 Tax=Pontibacter TaxID=323449 RepID=UPI00164E4B18|nr:MULTISPECIES: hypothetical protein [Pontibacter]MBC5773650.1 hypothetical protein [Pontibacter sp. KCTC 32443]